MPDEIRCSDHARAAYAAPNISAPASAASPQARHRGQSPRMAATASSSTPAITQRIPIIRIGGIVPMAIRMARKVEPQIR